MCLAEQQGGPYVHVILADGHSSGLYESKATDDVIALSYP